MRRHCVSTAGLRGKPMARVLVVYYQDPQQGLLTANEAYIYSFARYTSHRCTFLNVGLKAAPACITTGDFDLVIYHYTCLVYRRFPAEWQRICDLLEFTKSRGRVRIMLPSDESWCCNQLVQFVRDFEISRIFSFASEQARAVIYQGLDGGDVQFHRVLSYYVDPRLVRLSEILARRNSTRPIDIGGRMPTGSNMGSHGEIRAKIWSAFAEQAPMRGYSVDISSNYLHGKKWPKFLLDCRYQLSIETGSSIFDPDGSVLEYFERTPGATVVQLEAERPGVDGSLDYRALAPRHIDALLTKTAQVLVEGDYSGLLVPEVHYISLKRDLSNISEVLDRMADEEARVAMVERAYRDIVASPEFSFGHFANYVVDTSLDGGSPLGKNMTVREVAGVLPYAVYRGAARLRYLRTRVVLAQRKAGELLSRALGR